MVALELTQGQQTQHEYTVGPRTYPHQTTTAATHVYSHSSPPVVVLNQATVGRYANLSQPTRDWSTGTCGCCQDCKSCCFAFWCYPCFLCTLSKDMGENCCGPVCCGAYTRTGGCPNVFLTAMRTKMRTRYGIAGGICQDCCCMLCCEFCLTTQMARELKHSGNIFK